jgi:hypothetical protein
MEKIKIRFTIADEWSDTMYDESNQKVCVEVEWPFVPRIGEVVRLNYLECKLMSDLILEYISGDCRNPDEEYSPDMISDYDKVSTIHYSFDEGERYILITLER